MNQYDLWPGLENRIGDNAIYVARGNAPIPPPIAAAFDRHERVTASVVTRQGRAMEWTLFKLYGLRTAEFEQATHY